MNNKSIGIIVAHPDDEILGFGGIILKCIEEGHDVNILFLSTGLSSRENNTNKDDIINLRKIALNVSKALGVKKS